MEGECDSDLEEENASQSLNKQQTDPPKSSVIMPAIKLFTHSQSANDDELDKIASLQSQ